MLREWFGTKILLAGASLALVLSGATAAHAVPELQLYIDGSTYDPATETWITTDTTFDLWVIGNVEAMGTITDVMLSAAFVTGEEILGTISLTPKTTGVVPDPSIPIAPVLNFTSLDGQIPQLSDGSNLPTHGIYQTGVSFFEYGLGDFTETDSPVGDFIDGFPTSFPFMGQINVYEVVVSGFPSGIHFDVYDAVAAANHSTFGPFSHDAGLIPEPSSTALFLSGLAVVAGAIRRQRIP